MGNILLDVHIILSLEKVADHDHIIRKLLDFVINEYMKVATLKLEQVYETRLADHVILI